MEPVYFNTTNDRKFTEISHLFAGSERPLRQLRHPVVEILDTDIETVVRTKALAAYRAVQRPVLVEHGGVFIAHLQQLPGVMLKYMWDGLGSRVCDLLPPGADRRAVVRTALCYCDGRRRHVQVGEVHGTIAASPRGDSDLKWDTIFIPADESSTLAELAQLSLAAKMRLAPAIQAYRGIALVLAAT